MRVHQEITERIRYVEGFEVLAFGGPSHHPSNGYGFDRAASYKTPVGHWLAGRFRSSYPHFSATVVRPDGTSLADDVPIGVARAAFGELRSSPPLPFLPSYGQPFHFTFSDNIVETIVKLRSALQVAGINTEFERTDSFWSGRSFLIKGSFSKIHLPVFQHLAIPTILSALAAPFKLKFEYKVEYKFGSARVNLFECPKDHAYFGTDDFERLKKVRI